MVGVPPVVSSVNARPASPVSARLVPCDNAHPGAQPGAANCGERRIRTSVDIRRQIYSLLLLTAQPSPRTSALLTRLEAFVVRDN